MISQYNRNPKIENLIDLNLLRSFSKMTNKERQLMCILFSDRIESDGDIISIQIDILKEFTTLTDNDIKLFHNSPFKLLQSRSVEKETDSDISIFPWFFYLKIQTDISTIEYQLNPYIYLHLESLKRFFKLPLDHITKIKTQTALRLYEILATVGVMDGSTMVVEFEDLKRLMLEDMQSYSKSYYLDQSLITPGIKLINEIVNKPINMERTLATEAGSADRFIFYTDNKTIEEETISEMAEEVVEISTASSDNYFTKYVEAILNSGRVTHNIDYTHQDVIQLVNAYKSDMDLFAGNYYAIINSDQNKSVISLLLKFADQSIIDENQLLK